MTPDGEVAAAPARIFYGAFSDPASMSQAVRDIDPRATGPRGVGRTSRSFRGALARAALGQINVGVGRFDEGIPQSAGIPSVHTFMFATEPGVVRRVSGQMLGRNQLIHVRPNDETVTSSPPGMPWPFGIVTLPFDTLAAHGPAATGRDHGAPLDDDRMFLAPDAAMSRLIALMHDTSRLAKNTPWVLEAPEPAAALAGAITDALLTCLTQGRMRRDRAALGRHRQIVARFQQALRERPEEMLSLSAICAAVGVAQRTLNLACQEFLGQGPVQYARGRRLDLVHHRLLTSDPASARVTDVAMQYGFWELGRFAQAYRLRFDERPQDTLRRTA